MRPFCFEPCIPALLPERRGAHALQQHSRAGSADDAGGSRGSEYTAARKSDSPEAESAGVTRFSFIAYGDTRDGVMELIHSTSIHW
jgi:hypothetical protein